MRLDRPNKPKLSFLSHSVKEAKACEASRRRSNTEVALALDSESKVIWATAKLSSAHFWRGSGSRVWLLACGSAWLAALTRTKPGPRPHRDRGGCRITPAVISMAGAEGSDVESDMAICFLGSTRRSREAGYMGGYVPGGWRSGRMPESPN